jgi:hypothetical protein
VLGDHPRGAKFAIAQFRMLMQIAPPRDHLGFELVGTLVDEGVEGEGGIGGVHDGLSVGRRALGAAWYSGAFLCGLHAERQTFNASPNGPLSHQRKRRVAATFVA